MAANSMLLLALIALSAAACSYAQSTNSLVINEFDYDQPGTDYTEFIEILNKSPSAINLGSYTIKLVDKTGASYNTFTLPSYSLASGGYYIICSTNPSHVTPCNLQQQADTSQSDRTINLIRNTVGNSIAILSGSTIIDTVTYGGSAIATWTEGSPTVTDDSSYTAYGISRCPNGADTLNNYNDFAFEATTVGAANSCPGYGPAPPPPAGVHSPPPPAAKSSPPPPETAASPPPPAAKAPPPPASSFTFYFMVNQWVGSWTTTATCTDPNYPWNVPAGGLWTLHGLWPNFATPNSYPSNCDANYPFAISELQADGGALLNDMSLYWPSFKCVSGSSADDPTFWAHEWTTHGTCAESLVNYGPYTEEYNYFKLLITLRKTKVDIFNILKNAGITPGGTYSLSSMKTAVQNGLGVSLVDPHCDSSGRVTEIWVCVSTAGQIISCQSSWLASSTCPTTVTYPACNANGANC